MTLNMTDEQKQILEAAASIAGGMAAAAFTKSERGDLSQETIDHIVQLSVLIAREIETAVKHPG
jgi:hypothetical protein